MIYRVVEPPTDAAVGIAAAKLHLRVDHDGEDSLIFGYLLAATEYAEQMTGRALMPQTREVVLDAWGRGPVHLPGAPLQSVESITYTPPTGAAMVLAPSAYEVDTDSEPGRVYARSGVSWPATRRAHGAVRVRYKVGHNSVMAIPPTIAQAVLLLAGHWYANREAVVVGSISANIPFTVSALLAQHRLRSFR